MNVKTLLSHSLWIAHKDLLEFSRNRVMLVMLFVFPFFMMAMTGYIFPSGNSLKGMPVGIVNLDSVNGTQGMPGNDSIQFMAALNVINHGTGFFDLQKMDSYDSAKEKITKGEQNGAVILTANFTDNLEHGSQGYITLLYDQSNPQISQQLISIMNSVINNMGTRRAELNITRFNVSHNDSIAIITPYSVKTKGTVPGNPSYFEFLAPGMMMMVVMFSVMTGLPRAISHEKEAGTFDGVLAAPTSRFSIILGKTIAQSVRGVIQGAVVMVLALLLFGVTINGSIVLAVLLLLLGVFSFIGIGITITSVAADEETAQTFMMVLQFPMMFLSGVFFPIQQMPWYMQYISKALPLTYATQAMRKVVVLGAGIGDILTEVVVLLVVGIVLLIVSIPLFKKAMAR
jgi:ABC-2 type transport system permease protein